MFRQNLVRLNYVRAFPSFQRTHYVYQAPLNPRSKIEEPEYMRGHVQADNELFSRDFCLFIGKVVAGNIKRRHAGRKIIPRNGMSRHPPNSEYQVLNPDFIKQNSKKIPIILSDILIEFNCKKYTKRKQSNRKNVGSYIKYIYIYI